LEDNFKPDCDNIKRNIKSFTEDMLKEDEFKAFLHHLETCTECKSYVRSVDSFSNQLWRLGDVKVPSDFGSTVLFKLTQPDETPDEDQAPATSKKWFIGAIAFLLVAMTVSAGVIGYFKLRQPSQEEFQIIAVVDETAGESLDDQESNVVFEQYDGSDVTFDGTDDSIAFEWKGDSVSDESTAAADVSSGPKLIHWHFLQYNKTKELEALRLRRKKRSKKSDLRKQNAKIAKLGAESESGEQIKSVIGSLEEEIRKIEAELKKNFSEKERRDSEPLETLQSLDISLDYQDSDFIFFSTSGDLLKRVLDGIALVSPDSSSLDDFTPDVSHLPHKKYQVSVYTIKKETKVLHWHVHMSMMSQKFQLLKTIQDNGGVITYEFAEEVTISISSSKIEGIEAQMPAMRISLSQYGNQVTQEDESADGSIAVSIYFSK